MNAALTATAHKDMRGNWKCENRFPFVGKYELEVRTNKMFNGALNTNVSVNKMDGHFKTHRVFHDFSVNFITSHPKRVTGKVVEEQHTTALSQVEQFIKEATEHYANLKEDLNAE